MTTDDNLLVELVDGVKWSYHIAPDGSAIVDHPWEGNPYDPSIVKPDGAVVVPSRLGGRNVVALDEHAFLRCDRITSVTIPEGVKSIGNAAFWDCTKLESIVLPNSIQTIHDLAFWDCKQLESIIVPEGVLSIGEGVFCGCSSLQEITIPQTVTAIGERAFEYCRQLESIMLPYNVKSIGEGAFYGCDSLESLNIPNGVMSIGCGAFTGCSRLGTGIVAVDGCVLTVNGECPTSVVIPEGIRLIADGAFDHCDNVISMKIPRSLAIGEYAFGGCSSLLEFKVHPDNNVFACNAGVLYTKSKKRLLRCPRGRGGEFVVPEFVEEIGAWAFADCKNLTSIRMPVGLKEIGDLACCDCDNLSMVTIPTGSEFYGNEIFRGCHRLRMVFVKTKYIKSVEHSLKCGFSLPSDRVDFWAFGEDAQETETRREETSSIEQLEELAEDGDAVAMCKLAYWYVDKDLYRTIDLIAHSAMRLCPVAMTVIARLMLMLGQPGKNNRGKYWTWGIAIMAQASTENSIAGQDLRVFTNELVGKINRMKFGDNRSKYNAGLQKMCFAIESFMERMRKNPDAVSSVMNQYSVEHKNVHHISFAEFD